MKKLAVFAAFLTFFSPLVVHHLQGCAAGAQCSMQNNTKLTLDFYIDDVYQCTALSKGFCTSQVKAGEHSLKAKSRDGKFEKKGGLIEIKEGESKVWVVEQDL